MTRRKSKREQNGLMSEVERYLAAVDFFRTLDCEPCWKAERESQARIVARAPGR